MSLDLPSRSRPGGRAARRAARAAALPDHMRPVRPGLRGGTYRPLSEADVARIHATALDALEQIGLADAPPSGVEILVGAGAERGADGRIRPGGGGRRACGRRPAVAAPGVGGAPGSAGMHGGRKGIAARRGDGTRPPVADGIDVAARRGPTRRMGETHGIAVLRTIGARRGRAARGRPGGT